MKIADVTSELEQYLFMALLLRTLLISYGHLSCTAKSSIKDCYRDQVVGVFIAPYRGSSN